MQNIKLRFNLPNHTQHHNFSLYNNLLHNMMMKNISEKLFVSSLYFQLCVSETLG